MKSCAAKILSPVWRLVPTKALPTAGLIGSQLICSRLTTSLAVAEGDTG